MVNKLWWRGWGVLSSIDGDVVIGLVYRPSTLARASLGEDKRADPAMFQHD